MTFHLDNTLYVQTADACVRLDHDTLVIEVEDRDAVRVPLLHLHGIVLFDRAHMTGPALRRCAAEGCSVTMLDYRGRFCGRLEGPTSGNVLLRVAQHDALRDPERTVEIAKRFVGAKIRSSRAVILKGIRDAGNKSGLDRARADCECMKGLLSTLESSSTLDEVRGAEGEAAREYFAAFGALISGAKPDFAFAVRTRRPPRDRVNALLSFAYALLMAECCSGIETTGLDPQVGYLHALRPGRPALALDLMEEYRAGWADRLVMTMVNRRQLRSEHFEIQSGMGGSVQMTEQGRRTLISAFRERALRPVRHSGLERAIPMGLVPFVQSRLLARHLRDPRKPYMPFVWE